jgi:hypothetical protein
MDRQRREVRAEVHNGRGFYPVNEGDDDYEWESWNARYKQESRGGRWA